MGDAKKNNVSTAHLGERYMRHPLTGRNLKELDVATKAPAILERDREKLKRKAEKKSPDGDDRYVHPIGFSLNKGRFQEFPEGEATAHERGWTAYTTVGVPLVEERADIAQPPPDVISKQTYVNRTDPVPTKWSHTVEFSISNTISWSLQGQVQLTFGAKATASLQQQLQKSMAANQSQKTTLKNSKDNQGVDSEAQSQSTSTTTATGTATGTGELSAQLMLGITASVSGSLTTAFKTSSTLSGEVGSRVDVLATQRRQVRRFDYEFPISFGGWVALYYPEPVEVKETHPDGPQAKEPKYAKVIAWKLGETGAAEDTFDLTDEGRPFLQRGEAEVVSTLAGVHEVFEDTVVRCAAGMAQEPVSRHGPGGVTGRLQRGIRTGRDRGVHFDRGHVVLAEAVAHEGAGVAGPGADLQDLMAVFHLQLLDHVHDGDRGGGRRRRRAGHEVADLIGGEVPVELRGQRLVPVGDLRPLVRVGSDRSDREPPAVLRGQKHARVQEQLPRYGLHRFPPPGADEDARLRQAGGEGAAAGRERVSR